MGDEACMTTCYLHRLSLFLCQAATMVKPIHPFAELSPEECQKEITPGDVWPVSSISFGREKGEMVMANRHHASATDYCEQSTAGMDRHVFHHCVPFRMAIVRGLMELAVRVMPVGKVKLSMGGERLEGTGGRKVMYVRDGLTGPSSREETTMMLVTYTGLTLDQRPQYEPATAEQSAGVVRTLGLPAPTWVSVVQRMGAWQSTVEVSPMKMSRPDVTEWQGSDTLPLAMQVILLVVTTALPTWAVHAFGPLALSLPQRSPFWARPPPHVYVGLQARVEEIMSMAEIRHGAEGAIVIIDALSTRNQRPWMKGMYRFNVAGHVMMVTPRLLAWLGPEELEPMKERW